MDEDTEDLLRTWGLEEFIQNFKDNRVDSGALSLLTEDLAKELIKPIGPRAKFLANLREWKNVLQIASNGLVADDFFPCTSTASSQNETGLGIECETLSIEIPQNLDNDNSEQSTPSPNECLQSPELLKLLQSSNDGRALLLRETLDHSARGKLSDLIIGAELKTEPDKIISSTQLMNWAKQIPTIFKKEHTSTYFIPYINYNSQKKAAKGKLLNSLNKFRKRYKKLGLIETRRLSSSSSGSTSASNFDLNTLWKSSDIPVQSEEVINKLTWLRNSTAPLETVVAYWKETAESRISSLMKSNQTISEYMNEYPALTRPTGYVLMIEDFGFMYPTNVNCLVEEFPLYKNQIIELGKASNLKDLQKTLQKLEDNKNPDLSEELSSYVAFSILPYLLGPHTITTVTEKEDSIEKKTWRPSRSEIKDGFITEVGGVGDLLKTVSDRREKLSRLGHPLQPFIVAIPHEGANCDFYVVIEDTKFVFKNVVNAVDCCFKCIHALNAQYPAECKALWSFIQIGFYKLKTPWDKRYVGVNSLLSDLGINHSD